MKIEKERITIPNVEVEIRDIREDKINDDPYHVVFYKVIGADCKGLLESWVSKKDQKEIKDLGRYKVDLVVNQRFDNKKQRSQRNLKYQIKNLVEKK